MPRRDYEDDDLPRPRRRDPYDDDDRPRPRSRRHDEEDDYDDDPRPRRRQSNPAPIILAVVGGGLLLLVAVVVAGILVFRASARPAPPPNPPPMAWGGGPPPAMAPMRPEIPQGGPPFGPPGVGGPPMPPAPPGMAPRPPAQGNEVTISNLRLERGFAGRNELLFDYEFTRGRPFGLDYVAVVIDPKGEHATTDLHFLEQKNTIRLQEFGPFGGNFPSGTKVYIGKRQFGPRFNAPAPSPISNTLTLP
jgi:hypothetical protein